MSHEFVHGSDVWVDWPRLHEVLNVLVDVFELSEECLFDDLSAYVELCVWLKDVIDSVFHDVVAVYKAMHGSPAD